MTTLTISINNVSSYSLVEETFKLPDAIEQNSTCAFTIDDASGVASFKKGQRVTVTDTLEGLLFSGEIQSVKRHRGPDDVGTHIYHEIGCVDKSKILDQRTSNRQYTNQYAGAIAVDQIKDLGPMGILANYAIDVDDTQADFAAGTLSGTVAVNNVEDGNLELAPAGATVTVTENTSSAFSSGTLTNMTTSNNSLVPSATSAIKFVATQSVSGISNSFTYIKIWSGSVSIISGRYLAYDIWISSTSPEAKIGVDLHYSDGTSLRDLAVNNNGLNYDSQNKAPHPNTDLSGLAVDTWYHRKFLLDTMSGKTIDYVTIAMEGDKSGTYTAWIKNIYEVDASNTIINTFFNGSLSVNPPQQMQRQGYGASTVTVVNTYDCSTAKRVSPAYNIDHAKILKSSFISFKTNLPANYTFNLGYSLDGGNSFTACTNNTSLPNLLAGLSIASKTIQFQQTFTQNTGAAPDQVPSLSFLQCTLNPSYTATKSDVKVSATTNSEWNTSTTFNNTQAPSAILLLLGTIRNWITGDLSSQTLYGGAATGPNNANSCYQFVDSKQFRMEVHQSTEARSRCDFAGQWQNFICEFDVYIDNSLMKVGCVYRTSNWSNYDANYAYAVEIFGTTIALQRGSNSTQSVAGTRTQVATATVNLTSQTIHRIKLIISGSSHQIYFDDTLAINATDSTYTGSGYFGFRVSNGDASNGYISLFDNFGITITGLSGTWLSPSTSLTSASSYLNSVVSWQDVSIGNSTSILVESTINGGSSWQTVTNGGSIANLTVGQSLSGVSVQFRITLTTATASDMPQVQSFVAYILGGFSSTGTRISKALALSGVGTCGSTLVFWNAITPANTSITVATSLDGTSYTNVSNGGSISGLNQQPSPTIDSFNLLSASNYINTFRSGGSVAPWVWDTVHSRLTVSGGSNALLIYNGIASSNNVSVLADMDRSDGGGLVLHYKNSGSSLYYCVINDNLASSNPNTVYIYKYDFGGPYTYANTSISFTRGTYKRFIFQYINATLSVTMDGVQILNVLDNSTPITSGQSGLYNDTGTSQFYNLRVQPLGDDLTGKKVYTKVTLTSTDPTVTPQVADMSVLVTNPNIQAGALVPTADYRNTYRSDNIKDLAKRSDYLWNVKPDGSFIFMQRQTIPAPWVLVSSSAPTNNDILSGMYIEDLADLYRNRQTITGVKDTFNTNETKIGDGTATSWTLKYDVASVSLMTLNGQVVTFGQKSIDTGKNFYYEIGSNSIAADASTTLLINTDALTVYYTAEYETSVTRDNTGQFPGTISQKDYIAQCGLTVPTLTLLSQASASQNASGTSDDLDVSLCRKIVVDINVTAQSGTSPTVQFFIERKSADGFYTVLWSSSVISASSAQVFQSIGPKCSTKESLGATVRLRWTIGGSASPTKTFSASIQGHVDAGLAGIGVVEAVEDVSGQNINVPGANALADSKLQKNGLIGKVLHFDTRRTGLAAGQYLNCFVPELGLSDAGLLITSANREQKSYWDGSQMTQDYTFSVEATDGTNLPSWQKAMNDAGIV